MEKRDIKNARAPLTIDQAKQLIHTALEPSLKVLITVAITTGLRRGELLALRWQDIDMENEILHVRRIASSIGELGPTKTARTIALPEIALSMLKEQKRCQEQIYIKASEAGHVLDLVFPNEAGQYFNPSKLWQKYHALFVEVGLSHMRFHDLRYSTAALLLMMGVNIMVVQAILGFSQSRTVVKTLTPVSLSMQKEAMKKWDVLLENGEYNL